MKEYADKIVEELERALVGKRVLSVVYMNQENASELGWYKRPIIIELEDDIALFPMADDEGNDGGALATTLPGLGTVGVIR